MGVCKDVQALLALREMEYPNAEWPLGKTQKTTHVVEVVEKVEALCAIGVGGNKKWCSCYGE